MRLPAKIGAVEIAEDAVRIAVVKTGGRLPKVLETAEAPVSTRDEGDDLRTAQAEALRTAAAELSSPPSMYVLSLPASWAIIRQLSVPFRGRRKVAAAAPFELEPFLAIPIEELAVDFLPTRVVDNQTEVLAFGFRRNTLDELCAVLNNAEIPVDGAVLDATALTALWLATRHDTSGTQGVLHVRKNEAILAVLENKKLTYLRRIESSTDTLRSNPETFAREMTNILRARATEIKGCEPLRSLDITGIVLTEEERADIEKALELSVTNDDLPSQIPGFTDAVPWDREDSVVADPENRWTAPIAAAVSAAGGPFHLNFLRQQIGSRKTLRTLVNYGIVSCILSAMILMGFLAVMYTDYRNNVEKIDRIGEAVWQEFTATFPDAAIERPPADTGGFKSFEMMQLAADDERESSGTLSPEMFDRLTLLDIMREFGRHLPHSVAAIQEIRVSVSKNMTVTLHGEVMNPVEFNRGIESLRKANIFEVGEPQRRSDLGKETFTLTAIR